MTQPLTPRQRELFNSLLRDFLAEGFKSFTIDAAAKRYRCSKSTIYALGETRDAILRRVLVSFFREIARRTTPPAHTKTGSATHALESYFEAITAALRPASPDFMRDLTAETVAQEVFSINTKAATEIIHTILVRGVDSGEFRVSDAQFLSLFIYRAMNDIQRGTYSETISTADAYRELGRLILRGVTRN
ncbi:TetR/AcrR family transcriptional regulator [Corynebacterium mayonis]|uniref:TetR/AcrR family transcriptional regulator n=1 Tax=Corynebacterium mayonis TaxID=3062461 RepID=UPI00314035DA